MNCINLMLNERIAFQKNKEVKQNKKTLACNSLIYLPSSLKSSTTMTPLSKSGGVLLITL